MKVGIDLGTTNSALAWIDPAEAQDTAFPAVHVFAVPQLVAPGKHEARRTLPSFLLLEPGDPVGVYAREQGALVPTRLVHSAKSWLSNSGVDRTAKILPWDAPEEGRVFSPVEVSARYLGAFRDAWDAHGKYGPLAEQDVVLTVPASFDEEARELTVRAATEAGLTRLTLLEEPSAAFYSWISSNLAQSRRRLFDGQVVLICDVGGGTTDFSLVHVTRDGDHVEFTRTAVGRHLLLGGDNLDLTLAWLVESKLGRAISVRQRSGLLRQCSAAKERLLNDPRLASVEISIQGSGAALVGQALKAEIRREEALELALEGFLPLVARGTLPKDEKRSVFRELGLPYESDPAITKHLTAFLESAGRAPDAILFNGGFFIPEVCRHRVADAIEQWYGKRPEILENRDLDLAVATGAAYYSFARGSGHGVLVRGGLPRSFYIGLGENSAVCVMPRGAEEGVTLEVDREDVQLIANRPVSFRLYSSLTRTDDLAGQVVTVEPDFHRHAPLQAVIRFGKTGERLIPVKLGARLTEVGTLETWCDSKISDQRWRLQFQLRKSETAEAAGRRPEAVVSEEALERAEQLIRDVFGPGARAEITPEELPSKLEQTLALGRNSWPLPVIRRLADVFLSVIDGRKKSAAHEVRWFNLAGFCLRPGFGFPGDDFRIEQARRIYSGGPQYGNQTQNEIDWWIFWGRLAGGLNRNQQVDIFQRLTVILLPRGGKRQRVNSSLLRELWRTAASLELLPVSTKTELGDALIRQARGTGLRDTELWCLMRLGARELFHGPANQAVSPATATRWIEAMLAAPGAGDAMATLARRTGDPTRDVAPATLAAVRARLKGERQLAILEGEDQRGEIAMGRLFGEALPSGLVLTAS